MMPLAEIKELKATLVTYKVPNHICDFICFVVTTYEES